MGALVIGQFGALLLSFLIPIILAHLLTNDDFGLYAQFNLIVGFCVTFFSLGISSELYFFYPKAHSGKRKILIIQSFLILLILGLFTFFLFFIPLLRKLVITSDSLDKNFIYLALSVLFSLPTVIISVLYVLRHDNKTSSLYLPLSTILRVVLIFAWYFYNPSIESIFYALLTSYILLFLYTLYYIYISQKKIRVKNIFIFNLIKKQLSYSLPLGISNSTRILSLQLDKLILISFVSPSAYAIYAISSYGVPGLNQLYLSISQVYVPRMSKAYHEANIDEVKNLYRSMVLKTLSYTIPVVLIVIVFSPVIVPFIFSDKYVGSVPYFQIYLLTFVFVSMGNGLVLRATGRTKKSLYAYLYSLIFIIPVTYFGIKWYGLNGAIVSALISNILPRIFLTWYDKNVLGVPLSHIFPWKSIFKIILISSLVIIPFFLAEYFFALSIIIIVPLVLIYAILVFLIEAHYKVFLISKADIWMYVQRFLLRRNFNV